MLNIEKSSSLEIAIRTLDSEVATCVDNYHRGNCVGSKPVVKLKTVKEFGRQVIANKDCLVDIDILNAISTIVRQLLDSDKVRYNKNERDEINALLIGMKDLVGVIREKIDEITNETVEVVAE